MGDENKSGPEPRRGFPGGIFFFLLAIILLILTFQNFSGNETGNVSFSHQVEHLVNLDLIQPNESRKTALNDNLVTFSGKFRDRPTEEARSRYKYLEFLNQNHELSADKRLAALELEQLQKKVYTAADWFLHLSGLPLPTRGYWVVLPINNGADRENEVVLTTLSNKPIRSLAELQAAYPPSEEESGAFGKDLILLVQGFRSPILGIGNETMKQQLRGIEQNLTGAMQNPGQRKAIYGETLFQMRALVDDLNQETEQARLVQLRSVRSYLAELAHYAQITENLEKNQTQLDKAREAVADVIWFFNNQELSSRALERQDPEIFRHWFSQAKQEWETFSSRNKGLLFKAPDQPRNLVLEKTFKSEEPSLNYLGLLLTLMPVFLVACLLYFVFSKQMKGMGAGAMNFGKSPAKLLTKDRNKVTFKDVAGCNEAKEELEEIVEFLKNPAKFTALGARIPKGVLCIGAPGTGKTLIAKAVAGEAERPFFFISGSDFVEMFVGVGASRIRDMFSEARKQAPCIIFMDEVDAVGARRRREFGGNDEREQTLNQLLVEMDGFDPSEGIILIAATNRPDVLDQALLRPGRFDRRIVIDLPDIKGRFEILKVHARKIKLDASVELMDIARSTPGASGADLMNILNEAALLAARRGRSAVTAQEAREACDKVRYGKERRSLEMDENEKRTTAYHESGHAVVGLLVKHADPVDKVTIIPRGLSLGATHFMPKKNRLNYWKEELLDQIALMMGGRVAEEIFIGDISSGAQMDITQATRLARSMVCKWGMNPLLGTVAYDELNETLLNDLGSPGKSYSEETAKSIDSEVRKIIEKEHQRAREIIEAHKEMVHLMAQMLIEFETLDQEDIQEISKGAWDIEKKRARLKAAETLRINTPAPPLAVPSPPLSPSAPLRPI